MIVPSICSPFYCSDSKLTSVLEDILGGNCKTRVICCLKPAGAPEATISAVINGCGLLSKVKNFPVINDCLALVRYNLDACFNKLTFDYGRFAML